MEHVEMKKVKPMESKKQKKWSLSRMGLYDVFK